MSADSVADELVQSGYRRWLALEEQKAAVAADLKELMAELRGAGLDTKIARAAFRRQRNNEDAEKVAADQEFEAMVDLYLAALARNARIREEGPRKAERFRITRFSDGTGTFEKFDADGVLIEDDDDADELGNMHNLHNASPQPSEAGLPGAKASGSDFLAENANNEPLPSAPAPAAQTVPACEPVAASEAEPEAVASSAPIPSIDVRSRDPNEWEDQDWDDGQSIQPETANEIDVTTTVAAEVTTPDANTHGQTGTADDAGSTAIVPADAGAVAKKVGQSEQEATVERHVGTDAGSSSDDEAAPLPEVPADFHSDIPSDQLEARMRRTLKMRPDCRKPWSCGSANPGLCFACKKAAAEQGSEAA